MAISILKISDGTTTVDFITANSGYRITAWSPSVAKRRNGMLGGRGSYEDVVEEMEITIYTSTALAKLETLMHLMDQAERWSQGENVTAVLFHYQPTAGSSELKATILGPAGPGEAMVELPPNFADSPTVETIDPVRIRFKRLGMWLGAAVTSTSSSAQHPTALTMSGLTDVKIESPVLLKLNALTTDSTVVGNSFILATCAATTTAATQRLVILDAEDWASGAYTSVVDSTNKARGSDVLRYTPAGTTPASVSRSITSSVDQDVRRWGIFLNYRNNSGTTSFKVKIGLIDSFSGNLTYTPELIIAAGVSTPRWTFMGAVSLNNPLAVLWITIEASAASGSMDIDTIALLSLDKPTDKAIAIIADPIDTFTTAGDFILDHRLLSNQTSLAYFKRDNLTLAKVISPTRPDATIYMTGPVLAAAWLGSGETTAAYWRNTNQAGTVLSATFTATQTEARLAPE
jgi:hypothetical protein